MAARVGETIYALASARGRAAVAVTRVSGPRAWEAAAALAREATGRGTEEARAGGGRSGASGVGGGGLGDAREGARAGARARMRLVEFAAPGARADEPPLDVGFVVMWRAPRSFTGEDMVEFHGHGSLAATRALLDALGTLDGFRLAEPGEFARRAFRNGKMDLTQAEGLADLLDAETEAQRRQAMMLSRNGAQRAMYETWRRELMTCAAHCEAALDFGEEEDIASDVVENDVRGRVEGLRKTLQKYLDAPARGEMIRRGVRVAIVGAPNVGKSSMLNALAGRDAAIVSPHAGTTRDVLEVSLELGGYKVILSDTAGIRETDDDVEKMGIERALRRAEDADIVVALSDGSSDAASVHLTKLNLSGKDVITVWNKADVMSEARIRELTEITNESSADGHEAAVVSCLSGQGLDEFVAALTRIVARKCTGGESSSADAEVENDALAITRSRHRVNLARCVDALERALAPSAALELRAEELRSAARSLGRVTGTYDVEDVLDIVFRDFCIGK